MNDYSFREKVDSTQPTNSNIIYTRAATENSPKSVNTRSSDSGVRSVSTSQTTGMVTLRIAPREIPKSDKINSTK